MGETQPIVPDGFVCIAGLRKYGRRLIEKAMNDGIDEGTSLMCLMADWADMLNYTG